MYIIFCWINDVCDVCCGGDDVCACGVCGVCGCGGSDVCGYDVCDGGRQQRVRPSALLWAV
jgi:hypothetical protein